MSYNHGQTEETVSPQCDRYRVQRTHRGLAWLPQVAAEVKEGSLSGQGFPLRTVGPKPSWAPQPTAPEPERRQDNIWKWKAAGFLAARERWLEPQRVLQGQTHKIYFVATYPGLCQRRGGGWSADQRHFRRVWGSWLWGENWGSRHQDACAESFPRLQEPPCSGRALLSEWHPPEGKQQPCPQEWVCPTLGCLNLTADYRLARLTTEGGRLLVASDRLPRARLGHQLTSPGADSERKDSVKY